MERDKIKEMAAFLGMGYYRVNEEGTFIEADTKARQLFALPSDKDDLTEHSIADLYIFLEERDLRLQKLTDCGCSSNSDVLSLRIDGEHKLLYDISWCDFNENQEKHYSDLVSKIEKQVFFPKMFDKFPMGVYELDDQNRLVYFNKKAREIFGYPKGQEKELLGHNIGDFYEDHEQMKTYSEKVTRDGRAHDTLKFTRANQKTIQLDCFTEQIQPFNQARWGMIHDVTKREMYFKALDKMPASYYHIEYDENSAHEHKGKIVFCNEQYAKILGANKENLIGQDVSRYYASEKEAEKYYQALSDVDRRGEPLLNFPFRLRRADNNAIVHVAIDVHLIKAGDKIIGREGTIRDITKEVELQNEIKEKDEQFKKTTADIDKLIHTFIHPVLKFSGHAELLQQAGKILYKSIRKNKQIAIEKSKTGKQLEKQFEEIALQLQEVQKESFAAPILKPFFDKVTNILSYNLDRAGNSKRLIDNAIRDAAMWVLEQLDYAQYFNSDKNNQNLGHIITDEFILQLQDILFNYITQTSHILESETTVMKREVENLRRYIEKGKTRKFFFGRHDLAKLLTQNIELFKPIMAQKDIEIEYNSPDVLMAWISKTDIDRVICNLLHNANKYSYPGLGRTIRIVAKDWSINNRVQFAIESYGIPIRQEEISSGKIFEFGVRSECVYTTDRDGTGIGLYDAKEVLKAHRGEILIESKPASPDGDPTNYNQPFITTVIVSLPQKKEKRSH